MSNITTELHQGMSLYQLGRLDEAKAIYETILSKAPQCADAWHVLGMIAIAQKDHDRAFQLVSKALDLNPENPDIHKHIAVIHGRLGHFEQAVRQVSEAVLRLDPDNVDARSYLEAANREPVGEGPTDAPRRPAPASAPRRRC